MPPGSAAPRAVGAEAPGVAAILARAPRLKEPAARGVRLMVVRTVLTVRQATAAGMSVLALLLLAGIAIAPLGGTPAAPALAPSEASPSVSPAASPLPDAAIQGIPDAQAECADAQDVQVYARPYVAPTTGVPPPRPSIAPRACPAI